MKKKGFKTMAVSAVAGFLLLSLSFTAFATSGSGYEAYKDAFKSTVLTENVTVSTQFEVTDNGTIILSGDSIQKHDNENRSSKTSITVGEISKEFESSTNNGKTIVNTDGKYYTVNKGEEKFGRDHREKLTSSNTIKLAEMLADTLVGDVKNQFVKDGQTIRVNLEGVQIPELARLALSTAVENSNRREHYKNSDIRGHEASMKSVMDKMPELSNIDVKSIDMTATVDGNILKDHKFTVTITGQDENGVSHEISVMFLATITDIGNTNVDLIDTTGKEVSTIDWKDKYNKK